MKTRVEISAGVAHLILDDPDKKLNTLGKAMILELGQVLDELAVKAEVRALVIRSAKSGGFLAGADIDELRGIALSSGARAGGLQASQAGQALMNKIEDFPKPVLAAIHGPCLGGGLELALACHARLAANHPSTRLGLPELSLGIVPGFGGTYRLPRVLGLVRAMEMVLASKTLEAKQAYKQGLVDDLCSLEQLPQVAQEMALAPRRKKKPLPLALGIMQWPGLKNFAIARAKSKVLEKTRGRYPAPLRFLSILQSQYGKARDPALLAEAEALADTLASPEARNLVKLFFLSQEAKKQGGAQRPSKVRSVGVVGSGFMGSGIAIPLVDKAQVAVTLKDSNQAMLGRAMKKAWDYEMKRVKRKQVDQVEGLRRFQMLSPSAGTEGFQRLDLVIEAVPEVLDLKKKVFAELEGVMRPEAILASNTSTLPISQLSGGARHPQRFIGMHFFSPAEVMPLVEVIPGKETSAETTSATLDLAMKMGKTPVLVKDSPGFLVNRILLPYALEAAQMVAEGVPVAQVDEAAVDFGMPMGPIRLVGEVGVEVMLKALHSIVGAFQGHMAVPAWVEHPDLAKAFSKGQDGKWSVDAPLIQGWVNLPDPKLPDQDVQDRLFHAMLNEAARCLAEGIVTDPGLLDLAMVMGTGFPPYKGGPLTEADARGTSAVLTRGRLLAQKYHARLGPPELLEKKGTGGEKFYR
jgi:3-hydroxyacyl-CoA dehydrogenase/enoyl-CoA hydratase/3-hydroxybutyryl-CoA epimerase